jgi:mono/diheme cytochrome c family protein
MFLILAHILLLVTASPLFADGGEAAAIYEHWERPVNTGPSIPVESLYPEACAKCHRLQYEDWKGALHSKSTGPGLLGQLNPKADPETAASCYYCHAPLDIQSEVINGEDDSDMMGYMPNKSFNEKLKLSGVSCAACHVRDGGIAGPTAPNSDGPMTTVKAGHASVQKGFFEEAEFCAACHQLDEGFDLNGKLLVNTYREWKESSYGKNGIACQSCHMPGRRHLFRGIHDPEMVKSGITFEIETADSENRVASKLKITNSGVGHYFPTYTTPLVVIKGFLTDAKGNVLRGTLKEANIGRKVTIDLSREIFDTRIPPQKSYEFDYSVRRTVTAEKLVFEVSIFPDEFYNRFFESAIKSHDPAMKRAELKEALRNTSGSGYLLFKKEFPINR